MVEFDGRKAALHNLGCKVNAYETDAMKEQLEMAGFTIVPFEERADVYVINTCSVTGIADRKSRQMIHRARKLNPEAVVVAAGCYVQTVPDESALKDADILLGNNRKGMLVGELARLLEERDAEKNAGRAAGAEPKTAAPAEQSAGDLAGCETAGLDVGEQTSRTSAARNTEKKRRDFVQIEDLSRPGAYEEMQLSKIEGHTRAYIKVQDGCNQFCSYCLIPYARGRVRSRRLADAVEEIRRLAAGGVKEVVLTGIHLSSYGSDLPEFRDRGGTWHERSALVDLVEAVGEVPGIERIRLGSLEPTVVTQERARRLKNVRQFCPHFHLSLQSGCDATLHRMNRHYSAAEFAACCALLRETFEAPAITSDVIVGFPGESEAEFEETVKFLEEIALYETHVFRFSARQGTRAAVMPGAVSEPVKAERSERLIALSRENARRFEDVRCGMTNEVLFEEKVELGGTAYYTGLTREYVRVYRRSDEDLCGRILQGPILRLDNRLVLL